MSFELAPDAREWQARVRAFVDRELIPWEVEAELNSGEIPVEARDRHRATAQDMGLPAMDVPCERGEPRYWIDTGGRLAQTNNAPTLSRHDRSR